MSDKQAAQEAMRNLNNVQLFNGALGGRMTIEFSNLSELNYEENDNKNEGIF